MNSICATDGAAVSVLNDVCVCDSEWKLAGCPLPVDNITVLKTTEEFYQRNKDQVFVCSFDSLFAVCLISV